MSGTPGALVARRELVPNGVLGMAIFIATEVMFFAGLVSAHLVLRADSFGWPPLDQPRLPIAATALNTALLLASGATMLRAGVARVSRPRWLFATAALGSGFLALQGQEWVRLIGFGLTAHSSLYGAAFYTLVGAHALHALGGLILVCVALGRTRRSGASDSSFEPVRMFWLFVVSVWPILYATVYLS